MPNQPELSLVLPCYNEELNLRRLHAALKAAADPLGVEYEMIFTDDCSRDESWKLMRELAAADPRVRAQRFAYNCGESAALWAGLKAARGRILVTMDADLQNDPKELPRFLDALKGADCVCGSRVAARRQGDNLVRVLSSRVANAVRNWLSDEQVSDAGCTYRAFKRECIADLKYFKGMHRFMATLIKLEGFKVVEIEIGCNPRFAGQGNYGVWNRLFASFYDLLAVRWMKSRMKPYRVAEKTD